MAELQTLDEVVAETFSPEVVRAVAGVQGGSVEVKATTEDPVTRDARLRREAQDAALDRLKQLILFIVTLVSLGGVVGFCIYILATPGFSLDDKKWAQSVVSALIAGGVGYLFGRTHAPAK